MSSILLLVHAVALGFCRIKLKAVQRFFLFVIIGKLVVFSSNANYTRSIHFVSLSCAICIVTFIYLLAN